MKDHISICICTFRRNRMLKRLLSKIIVQEPDQLFDFSIVVVDNDPAGPAREIIALVEGVKIEYGIEPERTIPAARNRALRLATGNYIAIIDDDEFPPADWLKKMYRAINTFDVDGALGPVYPFFEKRPPAWLIKGNFCERPIHRTGTLLDWNQTRTGNVLLKRNVFDEHMLQFDLKWRTSGSDRAFFRQAMEHGYKFIAVEDAPVYETVPPERWRSSYYLRRALVHGYNAHINTADTLQGIARMSKPIKSAAVVVATLIALPISALLGKHVLIKCLERGAHHFSQLMAMLGIELVKRRDF